MPSFGIFRWFQPLDYTTKCIFLAKQTVIDQKNNIVLNAKPNLAIYAVAVSFVILLKHKTNCETINGILQQNILRSLGETACTLLQYCRCVALFLLHTE